MSKPIKILQVVYSMNRGGIESWLMHLLRNTDRSQFKIDFIIHTDKPGDYDNEIIALGSRIVHCARPSCVFQYIKSISKILVDNGPYDVVHTHGIIFNGIVLYLAHRNRIPIRIIHGHNIIQFGLPDNIFKQLYIYFNVIVSKRYATHGLACSGLAALSLFGPKWHDDPRWNVFYCGEDFNKFKKIINPSDIRNKLNVPEDSFVIGHVGNFRIEKNHRFLIRIVSELIKRDSSIYVVLVGDGALRKSIERDASSAGIGKHVVFTGSRDDVPDLLLGAMDLFLFPSIAEGLGLALVEAQAAGLHCIFSDIIAPEVDIVKPLIHRVSLLRSAKEWAQIVQQVQSEKKVVLKEDALLDIESSVFNINKSIKEISNLYFKAKKPDYRIV